MGGMIQAIGARLPDRVRSPMPPPSSCELEEKKRHGQRQHLRAPGRTGLELHRIDPEVGRQVDRLKALKERRDNDRVKQCLEELMEVARGEGNTMYPILLA